MLEKRTLPSDGTFGWFRVNCENFLKTHYSDSIKTPWAYRCGNFKIINDCSVRCGNCYDCKNYSFEKKD